MERTFVPHLSVGLNSKAVFSKPHLHPNQLPITVALRSLLGGTPSALKHLAWQRVLEYMKVHALHSFCVSVWLWIALSNICLDTEEPFQQSCKHWFGRMWAAAELCLDWLYFLLCLGSMTGCPMNDNFPRLYSFICLNYGINLVWKSL